MNSRPATGDGLKREDREVYETLVHFGAPLAGLSAARRMMLERAVPMGLRLAHEEAAVLRVLPLVVARHRTCLDWEKLRDEAQALGEAREVGMLLELTAELIADRSLEEKARAFRPATPLEEEFFFEPSGPFQRQLARLHTPDAARAWGIVLNMPEESFRSVLDKHLAEIHECRAH